MSKNIERFLDLYKDLELIGRNIYYPNLSFSENIVGKLIKDQSLKDFKDDINYCRIIRNFITHNPKIYGKYPIEPSLEVINLIENIIKSLKNPPLAIDSSIKRKNMIIATIYDKIIDVMERMRTYAYTHIPIIENEKLKGVFSDHTVCSYMINKKYFSIDDNTSIKDFEEYILLDVHSNEYFLFIDEKTTLHYVENLFNKSYKNKKILAVVFITDNGNVNGNIKGMITALDLLSDGK